LKTLYFPKLHPSQSTAFAENQPKRGERRKKDADNDRCDNVLLEIHTAQDD
jgi:hypothetical protein